MKTLYGTIPPLYTFRAMNTEPRPPLPHIVTNCEAYFKYTSPEHSYTCSSRGFLSAFKLNSTAYWKTTRRNKLILARIQNTKLCNGKCCIPPHFRICRAESVFFNTKTMPFATPYRITFSSVALPLLVADAKISGAVVAGEGWL